MCIYKETYAPLLMETITAPSPAGCYADKGESYEEYARQQFETMVSLLEKQSNEIAAVIVEPLVQCAGGMKMYHPIYLSLLREACDHYQVHLIADEIAVGFGRTGTFFACEQANISADFLCLSKGLTAGYLPLSVVLTTDNIYQAFYDDYTTLKAFLHSHSYTGNPLACRAALATLDIFAQDNVIENNRKLAQVMNEATRSLQDHPHVSEVRQQGMILAIEMVKHKATREPYPWQERRGLKVYQYALEKGALLRPLGNVIYFMPPYIITPEQIHQLAEIAHGGIDVATD
ncbi:truncated adenosylmethionine-8-amino-7-oxononanoate aminotransferase [Beggiatoa sp. PS]|nr:truncated adenosylmethionine-8-amino-7-oxononanoate aminotransferase [Beggiatoa sp. PS]